MQNKYPSFDSLPDSAYVRLCQLVRNPKKPGIPVPLPFSASTVWRKVHEGSFPSPVKLSAGVTAWPVGAIRNWLQQHSADNY